MPITPISELKRLGSLGSYYACSDYTDTNPEFGTVKDFKNLVYTAHLLGFKVIIDWVANHTGWDHRWTKEHPEFYRMNAEGNFFDANGWEDVIDLNYYNSSLRSEMIESMRFWIKECDIDGFRCDMAMLVPLDFWRQARQALDTEKKLFWLAECEEVAYHDVFDASYAWKLLHTMEALWRKEIKISGLKDALQFYHEKFPPTAFNTFFTTNHDENSHSGSEYERIGDAAEAFAVLCCTWNGIPLIYSGQELPNLKRLKFFDKDLIPWSGQYELNNFYKALLQLRKRNKAMRAGDGSVLTHYLQTSADGNIFAFCRKSGADQVVVVINFSEASISVQINDPLLDGNYKNIFTSEIFNADQGNFLHMEAWDFAVFEK
jgi:glycosidase